MSWCQSLSTMNTDIHVCCTHWYRNIGTSTHTQRIIFTLIHAHTQNPIHTPTCMHICTHTYNEAGKRPRNLNNENFDMIMHCESDVELGRIKAQFWWADYMSSVRDQSQSPWGRSLELTSGFREIINCWNKNLQRKQEPEWRELNKTIVACYQSPGWQLNSWLICLFIIGFRRWEDISLYKYLWSFVPHILHIKAPPEKHNEVELEEWP